MTQAKAQPITEYFVENSIACRFEYIAETLPYALAIDDGRIALTYEDLNRQSNQIAHAILAILPQGKQSRIAIYLEKGATYIAAILGVLKAGHVYVPMDMDFPRERNSFIVSNSEAAILIVDAQSKISAETLVDESCVILDLTDSAAGENSINPDLDISPDDHAYIIYTSGSTGNPKGVLQNQRNTIHGCMRRTKLQEITPADRMSLFYSCSVMGSVYCIFGALLNGASLHPYNIRKRGLESLADWLNKHQISIYHSVASVFRTFADCCKTPASFSVRLVIFGGEKVLTSDIGLARSVFGDQVHFFTGLGSTETGTVRHYPITPGMEISSKIVPIGYPVEGVEVALTDEYGNSVEKGQIGEITVISRYIALGYWNNPEATAKTFSVAESGDDIRIYRMGDLAQETSDQLLEHRGRKDFQVKIRGFRVEVGEVESALYAHPNIIEVAVAAREVGTETQLVAYLVLDKGVVETALSVNILNQHLKGKIPDYMIPVRYVVLDTLPQTPNNKIDRAALPIPLPANELQHDDSQPPSTKTEKLLLDTVKALLKQTAVGINHNFFELGGDSLSATQLAARVGKQLDIELPMKLIFGSATLKGLAADIDDICLQQDVSKAAEIHICAISTDKRVPLTYPQRLMWVVDQFHGPSATYNISNTVRLVGELNDQALKFAINKIVERHEPLRTIFPSDTAGPFQKILPFTEVGIDTDDLTNTPASSVGAEAVSLAQKLLQTPQDISRGPLFFARLIKLSESEHFLSLVFNHIVYDNIWSSGIFFRELDYWYRCYENPEAPEDLPSIDIRYADYAFWEKRRLESDRLVKDMAYWKQQLGDLPGPLEFPTDRPRPLKSSLHGSIVRFEVPQSTRLAIDNICRQYKVTSFMVLLAAWKSLLAIYTGEPDILVGTPSGRRHSAETEHLIGLFINTLVLRSKLVENGSFENLLFKVKKNLVEALSHDSVPIELLTRELKPKRIAGISPFFQHFFIHRNAKNNSWQVGDLSVSKVPLHQGGSKFDTTLSMLETETSLSGSLEYSVDLFDATTVEKIVADYLAILTIAVESPDLPLADYPLENNRLCLRA